jgi:alkaline phosphatase D
MRTSILVALLAPVLTAQTPGLTHGPFRGHVDATAMHVWARASEPGDYTLHLVALADGAPRAFTAAATAERDLVLHFAATGLPAGSAHTLRITRGDAVVHAGEAAWTTSLPDAASAATFAFGSCANERSHREQPIWDRILARAPHGLVLLGDTPYIDLGTTVARRARHRDFFAHPGVAAALRAIPTWTTWDDHDYAANDEFGAVPGSETARGVFVEYHAHGSYGDGTRGIWTRCRQGPIEVFVLDTRSCADTEPSLLAPGERSLLGKAQTGWLQQGLRASTAAIKVLACGMVWNGAVRPGKKDCWGNWLAERDALFAWLGEQRIEGVVLVSGDVHRSRVILHPTAAIVGYDLPEFVTSPLAQNVLESNAVPAPGLVFDAGEAHSCLFLTASVDVDSRATLRAVFQAGDGREFHTREFAPETLHRADAAAAYRRAVELLQVAFGERYERMPESEPISHETVAAAAPALAAWQQAQLTERCRFRSTSREPGLSEYMGELFLGLYKLQALAVARVQQAVADGDAETAVRGVSAHLTLARHLQQEPGGIAWATAAALEREVVAMHGAIAGAFEDAVEARVLGEVRAHLDKRRSVAEAAVAMRIETMQLFEFTMDALRLGGDRQAAAARTLAAEVRRAFLARVGPVFALGDAVTEENFAASCEQWAQLGAAMGEAAKERSQALQALKEPGAPGADVAADLGLWLARMLAPNLPDMLRTQIEALQGLRDVVR